MMKGSRAMKSLERARVRAIGLSTTAALAALVISATPAVAEPSEHPFEIVPGSFAISPSTTQAAAHEDLKTSFNFAQEPGGETHNDVRTVVVNLPAGFDASNTAVPTCPLVDLLSYTGQQGQLPECPIASQVGQISFELANLGAGRPPAHPTVPLYNMEVTSFGVAAELGFRTQVFSTTLQVGVRPGDTGLTIITPNIPKFEIRNISVTVWGVPAAHEHDAARGETCGAEFEFPPLCHNELGGPQESHIAPKPFLANPTSCGTHTATMTADSWEQPNAWTEASAEIPSIVECERVPFEPSIEVQPTTHSAESPTGLNVSLVVPQAWENPYSIATANLKDTTVALPQGITVNPSAGSGLGACTEAQYESETSSSAPGAGCPPESKIGSIEIETPILAEKIDGAVYVAKPFENPFNSLLALYIVARVPDRGIIIKVAGEVHLNPVTGQLVTTFENTPQQPFSRFTLKFRPGATAPLVSPEACGSYTAQGSLTPWSSLEPRLVSSVPFEVTSGVYEGPCPTGGVPPFKPQMQTGTQNNSAGAYSPFYLRLTREDGEQEITRFSTNLPPGLTGNLTGIPFCPDSAIEAARAVSGIQELNEPSCPKASEIGHTVVGAGVGTVLAQTPGRLYLAGPYHGAPLSLVSITSATVGPFDLGTVVIRFGLDINPTTAQVEVDASGSDPIPHIIDGIVVHVRDIRVYVDRSNFIVNPTSCDPMAISNVVTGAGADFTNPSDQVPVTVNTPFQAADCANLGFKPEFKVATSGHTSRQNGASLAVRLTYPSGPQGTQANIHSVKVDLPKQLPSRLTTLQKACTAEQFEADPAGCPAASRVGMATAITPLIPVPLTGPAYFVSHGGAAFPELIVVLQGYGFTIDLHGETFISKAGITSSTFSTVPDQPVTSFELTLPQGPNSALAANGNLCISKLGLPTEFVGQNGVAIHEVTKINVTGCKPAISIVRHGVKGKTATIVLNVPSAGRLTATAPGLSKATGRTSKAGTLTIKLILSKSEQTFLARHQGRRLEAKVNIRFTPTHGGKLTSSVTVLLG
jgi:hypothetical protein